MIYYITLMNEQGTMLEEALELPVTPEISWSDFEQLKAVKELLLANPTMHLQDVTPRGMPDKFTEEQEAENKKANNVDTGEEFTYNEDE
jgi:hypothetical protein